MTTLLALALTLLLPQDIDWAKVREQTARLAADDPAERAAAREEIKKVDKAALVEALKYHPTRNDAALALGVLGEDKARKVLSAMVKDKDPAVRAAAFEALGGLKVDESVFLKAFTDEPRVAFAAARGLARSRDGVRLLEQKLQQAQQRREMIALLAATVGLVSAGNLLYWELFLPCFENSDSRVASAAIIAAYQVHGPGVLNRYRRQLGSALRGPAMNSSLDAEIRLLAIALWLQSSPPVEDLAALLREPAVRRRVLDLITPAEPSSDDVPFWIELLKDAAVAEACGATVEAWIAKATGLSPEGDKIAKWEAWLDKALGDRVNAAIDRGVKYLKDTAQEGRWGSQWPEGAKTAALFTLLRCGVPVKDPVITGGLESLLDRTPLPVPRSVYVCSLYAMLFAEASMQLASDKDSEKLRARCMKRLNAVADFLVSAQRGDGSWGYDRGDSWWDLSNTQFAILGLRAAQNAGFRTPRTVWTKCLALLKTHQSSDGGWGYNGGNSYTMTAAGICMFIIARSSESGKPVEEVAEDESVKRGFKWLESNWAALRGLGRLYYWDYSLERACMVAGVKKIGGHDWYREGAERLLKEQAPDGRWTGAYDTVDTCFALLFLRRAYIPVGTPAAAKPVETPGGGDSKSSK